MLFLRQFVHSIPRAGQRHMRTARPKKSGSVDNFQKRRQPPENKFLNFIIMHKRSEIFPAGRLHCIRLADGESFRKPAQLLAGEQPDFFRIARPLELSIIQSFRAEHKSRLVKVQSLERISFSAAEQVQCICIRIHLVSVADKGHKAVEAAPHIRAPGDDINFCITGQCA
ncbi:hypothetical protein C823_001204 [Eubacterium plexicaudatum ASF492]|nr:hypothetical protein C823_001204 [Eubacterium plexicaudatum ASF492]